MDGIMQEQKSKPQIAEVGGGLLWKASQWNWGNTALIAALCVLAVFVLLYSGIFGW